MKTVQRTFIPGDKWVYFKIYTGIKTVDKILAKDISPIMDKLKKECFVTKWFFIRYNDPDFHLRVRVYASDESYIGDIIRLFYQYLNKRIKSNEIWKVQLDTYNRELERYRGTLIEDAESVFWIDSECILSIIKSLNKMHNENYRWMIALKQIDSILTDFSLNLQRKQELMKNMSDAFKSEFGFNMYNAKQFNSKFRENKKMIESVLSSKMEDSYFLSLCRLIEKRDKRLVPVVSEIEEKLPSSKEKKGIDSLLVSYIHMMLNRLFRSRNRLHELILYDFMYRYYTSEIAQNKNRAAR